MRFIFFVFIAVIFNFSLQAQDREFLKGKITNDSLLTQVHIVNMTSEKGTLSEASGVFAIEVTPGDSILFSSVQYKNITIAVRPEMLEKIFEIELEEEINELDEVQLHELSGNLQQDIGNIETVNQADFGIPYSDKPPPTIVERKIYALSDPRDPVGQLYGVISGERKKLKQALENERLNNRILKARYLLSENFYKVELSLKEAEVMNFLYYCAENPGFMRLIKEENLLGLIEFYKNTISNFRDHISLD